MPTLPDDKQDGPDLDQQAEAGFAIDAPNFDSNSLSLLSESLMGARKAAELVKTAIDFPVLDFVKSIQLPDVTALTNMMRDPLEGIDISGLAMRDKTVVVQKTAWEIEKEEREAYRTELEIKKLEAELNIARALQTPQYDPATGIITFIGKKIQIPLNSNLEQVCRIVLKNVKTMKLEWSWDQVFDDNSIGSTKHNRMKLYTAVRSINEKVALQTQISDFLLGLPVGTVKLNPAFLAK